MISSNQQAVQMAMLGVTRARSPEVRALAAKIAADHGSEIIMMNRWRKSWGMPMMTPGSTAHMGSIGAGMLNGEGMMNGADMTSLSRLSGGAFDERFLAMMTVNHAGAVRMAHREQGAGKDIAAKRLAASMVTNQNTEVAQMKAMMTAGGT